ncbi:hypothetical protein Droror1_Dr00018972 [Drosera rotundifolia]
MVQDQVFSPRSTTQGLFRPQAQVCRVDVCSESDAGISPRISFSHDLNEGDIVPVETYPCRQDASLLDSSSSFEFPFYVSDNSGRVNIEEASTADELFADGKILPMNIIIKKPEMDAIALGQPEKDQASALDPTMESTVLKRTNEEEYMGYGCEMGKQKSPWKFTRSFSLNCYGGGGTSKAFGALMKLSRSFSMGEKTTQDDKTMKGLIGSMRSLLGSNSACESKRENKAVEEARSFKFFMRSSSLNCDNRGRNGSFINFLSRSSSTDSETKLRPIGLKKRYQKLQCDKGSYGAGMKSCPPKNSETKDLLTRRRRGKKIYGSNYEAGVRPLLNLPSPCVSGIHVDLSGLSSLLCYGNGDRKKRK